MEFSLGSWPKSPSPFFSNLEDMELLFASAEQTEIGAGFFKNFTSLKLERLLLFTYKSLNLNVAADLQENFPSLSHLYIDGCFMEKEELSEHTPKFEKLELLDIPANGILLDKQLAHYFGKPSDLPHLKNLALTKLPTVVGQPSFIFDNDGLISQF
ncbi:hypothetical protein DSO57_1039357 [Entomophthora muscae]|uniref:Uncharacterized protein n=1 Tax=Entomophthora muscae TaxID=34485 RepID=A0ACC2RPA4_9FUNG|nr:hypothetical protein DSO57_1039357 [Entomophthora muscae]